MSYRNGTSNAEREKQENTESWVREIEAKFRSYNRFEYRLKREKRSIYKWPNDLVVASSLSHHREPRTIYFGPYHHRNKNLQHMEHHKERALYRVLDRSGVPLSSFVESLKGILQILQDSYDNLDPELSSDLFLRMMLLDGCFLLELLRIYEDIIRAYEPFFRMDESSLITVILRDMLILENQIPLLVLGKLLEVEKGIENNNDQYLHVLISNFYSFRFQIEGPGLHILDIYRKCLTGDSRVPEEQTPVSNSLHWQPWLHDLVAKGVKCIVIAIPILVFWLLRGRIPKLGHTRSASRLHEAGIEFKAGDPRTGLKIAFDEKNGELTLPCITIDDFTATLYMNLMTFERMHPPLKTKEKVTPYVVLMDELIDTSEDVRLLCSKGIVSNFLGSNEDAAKLFNTLCDGHILHLQRHILPLREQLQRYVTSDWNMAVAYLKWNYFQNPWSVMSLLAAIILLTLTFIQTVFSGMALKDGKKD